MIVSKFIIPLVRNAIPFISKPVLRLPFATPLRAYISVIPKRTFATEAKGPEKNAKKDDAKKEEMKKDEAKKEETKKPEEKKDPKEEELEVIV